jgi:hypothetical protein
MHTENSNKLGGKESALLIFESAMAVLYLVFALLFLFPSLFHVHLVIQNGLGTLLGIILAIYGVFRVYRAINKFRNRNKE